MNRKPPKKTSLKRRAASSTESVAKLKQTIAAQARELRQDEGENWQTIIKGIGPVSKSHHYVNLSLDEQAAHH